jgi:hypothetical protein
MTQTNTASLNFARLVNDRAYQRVKEALQQHISKDTEDYATQASLLLKLQSLRAAKATLDAANVAPVKGTIDLEAPLIPELEKQIDSEITSAIEMDLSDMPKFLKAGPTKHGPNGTVSENAH